MDTIEQAYSECVDAIWNDDPDKLREILAKVPQVVLHHDGLGTLLHSAISDGENIEVVLLLIDAGSDINAIAPIGGNALCKAVRCKNPERSFQLVALLLERGAELALDPHCNALIRAVNSNNVQAVQSLLSAGYDPHYTFRNLSGSVRNALSLAVVQGRTEIADMLRAAGCQMPREEDVATDLSMTNEETVAPEVGEAVPAEESSGELSMTAKIYDAISEDDVERLKSLLQQADPSAIEDHFIHRAAECGSLEVLRHLVAQGFDVNQYNSLGESALYHAACAEQIDAVALLLALGSKIDVSPSGNPVLIAVADSNVEILRMLIEYGGNPHFTYRRMSGQIRNALSYAIDLGNEEIIEFLKAAGCQMPREEDVAIDLCPANEEKVAPEVGEELAV